MIDTRLWSGYPLCSPQGICCSPGLCHLSCPDPCGYGSLPCYFPSGSSPCGPTCFPASGINCYPEWNYGWLSGPGCYAPCDGYYPCGYGGSYGYPFSCGGSGYQPCYYGYLSGYGSSCYNPCSSSYISGSGKFRYVPQSYSCASNMDAGCYEPCGQNYLPGQSSRCYKPPGKRYPSSYGGTCYEPHVKRFPSYGSSCYEPRGYGYISTYGGSFSKPGSYGYSGSCFPPCGSTYLPTCNQPRYAYRRRYSSRPVSSDPCFYGSGLSDHSHVRRCSSGCSSD